MIGWEYSPDHEKAGAFHPMDLRREKQIPGGGEGFALRSYINDLMGILGSPGQFFSDLPQETGYKRPLGFLLVSCLFFTAASLLYLRVSPMLMGGIFFVNALFMPFIAAAVTYLVTVVTPGNRARFKRLFAVHAFSGGVTLLVSWIPLFVWLTEPWKWVLIALGMVRACGLGWRRTLTVISLTIAGLILLFWPLAPLALHIRGLVG